MKGQWPVIDLGLRLVAALVAVVIAPLALIAGLFATDAGTEEAMHVGGMLATGGVIGALWILVASLAPRLPERLVPGSPAMKLIVIRGPCYLVAIVAVVLCLVMLSQ